MKQFFLLLVLSLLFLFPTAGLSLSVSSGHMLDRFELIPDEKTPFLTFKGFFDPGQFPHIQISPKKFQDRNFRSSAQHIDQQHSPAGTGSNFLFRGGYHGENAT